MNTSIVDAISSIGHTANLKIIAEWVENDAVYNELQRIGIDYAQGYGIEKPQSVSLFELPSHFKADTSG
jgi:EAL domain-containing protein (putative c-di-GMP-specific phosphodiesterase class I)